MSPSTPTTGLELRLVAACALVDRDGRVLIAQRPRGRTLSGLWEFPGGKVQPGETPEAALTRELREEIGIEVARHCLAPLCFASHAYSGFHLLMTLFLCRIWEGTARALEDQTLAWVRAKDLRQYEMPAANAPLVAMLQDWL